MPCQLDQSVLYPTYEADRRRLVLNSPARRISGGSGVCKFYVLQSIVLIFLQVLNVCTLPVSPKASPRNSPFTSPRGSNQWSNSSRHPSFGDASSASISRRGSRFDVEIRETPQEEAEAVEADKQKKLSVTGSCSGVNSTPKGSRQHLTIPTKTSKELSSSSDTLSGFKV